MTDCVSDPAETCFDPIKAAILAQRAGRIDEAFWLVFIFVHFGKHRKDPWNYQRLVYGRCGSGDRRWDWPNISGDPSGFRVWLQDHGDHIARSSGGFGNHRKYESLNAQSENGTGAVVESYVRWVRPPRSHRELFEEVTAPAQGNANAAFDLLYESMAVVRRFGRTARFDYLCMAGKLGLASIKAGSPYLKGATGPVRGARLLFGRAKDARISTVDLDMWLRKLDEDLCVGMQVLEDSLCNWQKNPRSFVRFRG